MMATVPSSAPLVGKRKTWLVPSLLAFVLSFLAILPSIWALPQHGDEMFYAWSSQYYWGKLTHLDFSHTYDELPSFSDPGWSPYSVWMVTGPTLTRLVYGATLAITGAPAPRVPYNWDEPAIQGPETLIPPGTLVTLRVAAVACAALGFALFAARLGWIGFLATGLMLLVPSARDDFARAWAEGPLLLGFGLCAIAYGTRWFGAACGAAVTFKLTGLAVWLLTFIPGSTGFKRLPIVSSWVSALAVFTALTPAAWFLDGPLYLGLMVLLRMDWFVGYSHRVSTTVNYVPPTPEVGAPLGLFLPTRYLWPLEWCICLGLAWILVRTYPGLRARAVALVRPRVSAASPGR
jgi:hypothetical protein